MDNQDQNLDQTEQTQPEMIPVSEVEGLKSALGKERQNAAALAKKLKQFEGVDVSEYQTLKQELEELRSLDPAKEADVLATKKFKGIQEQMAAKHQEELQKVLQERDQYKTKFMTSMVDDRAVAALKAAGGTDETVELLLPQLKNAMRLNEEDMSIQMLDTDGTPMIGSSDGSYMTVSQYISKMLDSKSSWKMAFPSQKVSVSGKLPSQTSGIDGKKLSRKEIKGTPKEAEMLKTLGLAKFMEVTVP